MIYPNLMELKTVAETIKERSLALRDRLRARGFDEAADAYDNDGPELLETRCLCCGEDFEWDPDEDAEAPDFCSARCGREMDAVEAEREADRRSEERMIERIELEGRERAHED